jgi:hypothetical protein
MNRMRLYTATLLVWVAVAAQPVEGAITSVVETDGDAEATDTIVAQWTGQTWPVSVANEPIPGAAIGDSYTVGVFGHMAPAFVDRNHRYSDHSVQATAVPPDFTIPAYLVGQQYIMSGNDNRDNASYRLDVTVDTPSTAYMLIDNRLGGNGNATPPTFGPTAMQWIVDEAWMPTSNGLNRTMDPAVPDEVPIDEGANNSIEQWFSVYKKDFPAGTFSLLQADNAGQNMYGVVVAASGPPLLPGDTDNNGMVEFADFEPIRDNFRKMVSSRALGDLVSNGVVDFDDFRQWKTAFIGGGGSLAGLELGVFGTSVPEPSSAVVLLVSVAMVFPCRIRKRGAATGPEAIR